MTSCALCNAEGASAFAVSPREDSVPLCPVCRAGAEDGPQDGPHWRCLNEAIWSPEPAVQVLAWRLLKALPEAPWAREALEIAWLEPDVLAWAEEGSGAAHGTVLASGDTVTLIKDLPVKGAGFTAKRGTAVRKIALVPDNANHLEGKVEGQRIVILCQFVKKA